MRVCFIGHRDIFENIREKLKKLLKMRLKMVLTFSQWERMAILIEWHLAFVEN